MCLGQRLISGKTGKYCRDVDSLTLEIGTQLFNICSSLKFDFARCRWPLLRFVYNDWMGWVNDLSWENQKIPAHLKNHRLSSKIYRVTEIKHSFIDFYSTFLKTFLRAMYLIKISLN